MSPEASTVILARVSSKSQEDEGYSLDSQLKLLTDYCTHKQLRIVKVFKIAETASKEHSRKIFQELLAFIAKEDIFHLAVEKTDRLTRNFKDSVAIDEWLEKDSRRMVHAVKENILLHKEAKSDVKFMWNIHLSVAKKYTDNLREEAMKGWAEKLAQGWLPSFPPPGYMTITQNGKRIHVHDPKTCKLIKSAFELYLEPAQTIKTVTLAMNEMGIRTRGGRPYAKSNVQLMLTNPFYIGINRFNGKEYPGAQEPLITKQLYDRVQDKMTRKLPTKYRMHNPVFKNLIECANCGCKVTWQLQKGRYYGTCQRVRDECKGRKLLREDTAEDLVVSMLRNLVSPSEDVITWLATEMRRRYREAIETTENMISSVNSQIDRLKRMEENLYDDKLAGDITQEKYNVKKKEIQDEVVRLQDNLKAVDQSLGFKLEKRLVLLELSQKAAEIYRTRTPEQKRVIITKLFKNIQFKGDGLEVTYTNFSLIIANGVQELASKQGGNNERPN